MSRNLEFPKIFLFEFEPDEDEILEDLLTFISWLDLRILKFNLKLIKNTL